MSLSNSGKKKGGSFLSRQAQAKSKTKVKPTTEEELLSKKTISPDDVLGLQCATTGKNLYVLTLF